MLQNLGDHIKSCIKNAAKAERRANEVTDPGLKADYLALAAQKAWSGSCSILRKPRMH